jgi:hypothetical protein
MFFGSKKPAGETVLLVDVENGSVASGLLRLEPGKQPRLYGAARRAIALPRTVSAVGLQHKVLQVARESLQHTAGVAARMRGYPQLLALGTVARSEIFLSPPWTSLESPLGHSPTGAARWQHETGVVEEVSSLVSGLFGYVPTGLHPAARSLASVTQGLYPDEESLLILNITGEIAEVLLAGQGAIHGRATVPLGHHHVLRTLGSHAGLSEPEARSAMRLYVESGRHAAHEALESTARHFAQEFKDVATEMINDSTRTVVVVAHEPSGEWFARSLSDAPGFEELFPQGGVVRALRTRQVAPYLDGGSKDLLLMLQSLYIDSRLGSAVY